MNVNDDPAASRVIFLNLGNFIMPLVPRILQPGWPLQRILEVEAHASENSQG